MRKMKYRYLRARKPHTRMTYGKLFFLCCRSNISMKVFNISAESFLFYPIQVVCRSAGLARPVEMLCCICLGPTVPSSVGPIFHYSLWYITKYDISGSVRFVRVCVCSTSANTPLSLSCICVRVCVCGWYAVRVLWCYTRTGAQQTRYLQSHDCAMAIAPVIQPTMPDPPLPLISKCLCAHHKLCQMNLTPPLLFFSSLIFLVSFFFLLFCETGIFFSSLIENSKLKNQNNVRDYFRCAIGLYKLLFSCRYRHWCLQDTEFKWKLLC